MKPGYKTSEFWLLILCWVLTFLTSANVFAAESVYQKIGVLVLTALAQLGYTVARAKEKLLNATPPAPPTSTSNNTTVAIG